jgi:hypothetical protein
MDKEHSNEYYDYFGKHKDDRTYYIKKGQIMSGYTIGILLIDVWYPLLPGNMANADTFNFPVRHKLIEGSVQERVHGNDRSLIDNIIKAAKELEMEGVRAICGACGYLGNFQNEVRESIDAPVYLSSLLQIPFIRAGLKKNQKIGIICAIGASFTKDLFRNCGIEDSSFCVVRGLEEEKNFSAIANSDKGFFNNENIKNEVLGAAAQLVNENPDIGAILLECSDMPPYASAVQQAVKLPVFDFVTMVNWVHNAVAQKPYYGFI